MLEAIRNVPNLPEPYTTLGNMHEVLDQPRQALNFFMIAAHMGRKGKVCMCVCVCRGIVWVGLCVVGWVVGLCGIVWGMGCGEDGWHTDVPEELGASCGLDQRCHVLSVCVTVGIDAACSQGPYAGLSARCCPDVQLLARWQRLPKPPLSMLHYILCSDLCVCVCVRALARHSIAL